VTLAPKANTLTVQVKIKVICPRGGYRHNTKSIYTVTIQLIKFAVNTIIKFSNVSNFAVQLTVCDRVHSLHCVLTCFEVQCLCSN